MNSRIDSLALVHSACWQELGRAAADPEHEWRVMALATAEGDTAELRSVVLREVDAEGQSLVFFTDARSPKVAQLQSRPRGTLLVWSRRLGWQLRIRCRIELETSGLAVSSRWARLKMTPAAQDYLSPLPPGTPVDHFLPERGSRDYFAVASAYVDQLDWLEVHRDGHRRALFDAEGGRWLSP
jgi:pyridoxamine 5'-phosphate oxidase